MFASRGAEEGVGFISSTGEMQVTTISDSKIAAYGTALALCTEDVAAVHIRLTNAPCCARDRPDLGATPLIGGAILSGT